MSRGGSRRGDAPVHRRDSNEGVILRERQNWRIFATFARQEYPECLAIIEKQLRACNGLAEYPIYVKGGCLDVVFTALAVTSINDCVQGKCIAILQLLHLVHFNELHVM